MKVAFSVVLALGWNCLLGDPAADASEPLLEQLHSHCGECHNSATTEGEFDPALPTAAKQSEESRARVLERNRKRVSDGEMPPSDADPLLPADRTALLALLNTKPGSVAVRLRGDPGDVAMPRLTPYEYRNVSRDLSGGVVTDGGRLLPNEGGAGEGFSKVGAAQVMTLPQYKKYMAAAKDALRHLRVYPVVVGLSKASPEHRPQSGPVSEPPATELAWKPYARPAVDSPSAARKEVVDEIIAWYVAQQLEFNRHVSHVNVGFLEGVLNDQLHGISHHKDDAEKLSSYQRINKFHVEQLAYLLTKMKQIDEGNGTTLLDNVLLLYGSNMFNGDSHDSRNLPLVLAGHGGGQISGGRVLDFSNNPEEEQRACNLYVTLAQIMGVDCWRFGDSVSPTRLL